MHTLIMKLSNSVNNMLATSVSPIEADKLLQVIGMVVRINSSIVPGRAIVDLPLPKSCAKCPLFTNPRDGWCHAKPELYVTEKHSFTDSRHPECPLMLMGK